MSNQKTGFKNALKYGFSPIRGASVQRRMNSTFVNSEEKKDAREIQADKGNNINLINHVELSHREVRIKEMHRHKKINIKCPESKHIPKDDY